MPEARVWPLMSPATLPTTDGRPAALLYAVSKSASACAATGPPANIVPLTVPGGKPAVAPPGPDPRFPFTMVKPVLLTLSPARTAKEAAESRATGIISAAELWHGSIKAPAMTKPVRIRVVSFIMCPFVIIIFVLCGT